MTGLLESVKSFFNGEGSSSPNFTGNTSSKATISLEDLKTLSKNFKLGNREVQTFPKADKEALRMMERGSDGGEVIEIPPTKPVPPASAVTGTVVDIPKIPEVGKPVDLSNGSTLSLSSSGEVNFAIPANAGVVSIDLSQLFKQTPGGKPQVLNLQSGTSKPLEASISVAEDGSSIVNVAGIKFPVAKDSNITVISEKGKTFLQVIDQSGNATKISSSLDPNSGVALVTQEVILKDSESLIKSGLADTGVTSIGVTVDSGSSPANRMLRGKAIPDTEKDANIVGFCDNDGKNFAVSVDCGDTFVQLESCLVDFNAGYSGAKPSVAANCKGTAKIEESIKIGSKENTASASMSIDKDGLPIYTLEDVSAKGVCIPVSQGKGVTVMSASDASTEIKLTCSGDDAALTGAGNASVTTCDKNILIKSKSGGGLSVGTSDEAFQACGGILAPGEVDDGTTAVRYSGKSISKGGISIGSCSGSGFVEFSTDGGGTEISVQLASSKCGSQEIKFIEQLTDKCCKPTGKFCLAPGQIILEGAKSPYDKEICGTKDYIVAIENKGRVGPGECDVLQPSESGTDTGVGLEFSENCVIKTLKQCAYKTDEGRVIISSDSVKSDDVLDIAVAKCYGEGLVIEKGENGCGKMIQKLPPYQLTEFDPSTGNYVINKFIFDSGDLVAAFNESAAGSSFIKSGYGLWDLACAAETGISPCVIDRNILDMDFLVPSNRSDLYGAQAASTTDLYSIAVPLSSI